MSKKYLIESDKDWNEELIHEMYEEIRKIGEDELGLDIYPNSLEIISADQMLDSYSNRGGVPIYYHHWSFGKDFVQNFKSYKGGQTGLAYEIVINTNPCRNYLMESNDAMMMALVIAHAAFGHNFVFKNNYLFKEYTDAGTIVDYLTYAREYITKCEDQHGPHEVERVLDACHTLQMYGFNKYQRRVKSLSELKDIPIYDTSDMAYMWDKVVPAKKKESDHKRDEYTFDKDPHENILEFIEKQSPRLKGWQRDIVAIIKNLSTYYAPNIQTQVLNEGFASFTHYHIMKRLEEKGILSPGAWMSFLHSHTGVTFQPAHDKPYYSGWNVYALGFAIFQDIKRMCEEPTDEDRKWFPELMGRDWREVTQNAVRDHRDESFILQFLSPKVIRDFRMFQVNQNYEEGFGTAEEIHDELGYRTIRATLAGSKNLINFIPNIQVNGADLTGDRELILEYLPHENRMLDPESAEETLMHISYLWGYDVRLVEKMIDEDGDHEWETLYRVSHPGVDD